MNKIKTALMAATAVLCVYAAAPSEAREIKVATATFHLKDQAYNIPKMVEMAGDAAKNGAKLVVFPEMASTGFLYLTAAELYMTPVSGSFSIRP